MNVLVVLGHPRTDSLCGGLAEAYAAGARDAGLEVRALALGECEFDRDVHTECPSDQALEPDLAAAEREIEWADHLVFVYPNWWATMPALLKGFFDRLFRPGFAFSMYEDDEGAGHEKLLSGKTAELVVTMDMPPWVYRWIYRQPGTNAVKRGILGYAGVETTRTTEFGPVEDSTANERSEWLERAEELGRRLESGPKSDRQRVVDRATTWIGALRLQFYPMAWIAYTVGALAAAGSGVLTSAVYWLGFAFLFCLEAATVLSNEYADYETDRQNTFAGPFTGGSRVLVEGDLSFGDLRRGIGIGLGLAGAFGAGVLAAGAGSLPAMAAAMAILSVLALGYTLAPLKLAYRTLGELDVAVTHSIGVLLCGYLFLGGTWTDAEPWLLGLPFLLSILPAITLAGVPDYAADRAAGKKTLAVRFGVGGAAAVAAGTALLAAAVGSLWQFLGIVDAYGPAIYLGIPHALVLVWLLRTRLDLETPGRIDVLMVASLSYIVWFGVVPLVGLL
ncbi:NAD(P)H-dependent oxidoreductase [Natrononativus amylolyticus]|uniref:NAD(P)H-dependent oxidoreductase n=1 Tax=Natrononativus amylolyticus TaxID=2963434 RepID=UPI0020CF26F9|nr:NAD(P)H-dependent oxidoreductase [Natrononativus amylolyticus]